MNPKNPRYVDYGGRGIRFLFTSFEQFLSHIGRKPSPELTLDRIENNGHYEPGNVRWATRAEQQRNQRSNVLTMNEAERIRRLAVSGHATTDLSRKFQVSPSIISQVITYRTWIPEIHSAQEEAVAV